MEMQQQRLGVSHSGELMKGWVEAEPVGLMCEHGTCGRSPIGYKRIPTGSAWDEEPIFLCSEHAPLYLKDTWRKRVALWIMRKLKISQ